MIGTALALAPAAAIASSGGVPPGLPTVPPPSGTCGAGTQSGTGGVAETAPTCSPEAATLTASGRAIAPASAPTEVKDVIAAANRISTKPYVWGGGHRRWWDRGYDCSGAVSYVLHKGGFLTSPLDSTGFMRWGDPGAGQWITVYSNRGHAYAVIAGLRWDTAGDESGTGPRWHPTRPPAASGTFRVRHPTGF
jgi:cell wall-associated NlpC family hydrolase